MPVEALPWYYDPAVVEAVKAKVPLPDIRLVDCDRCYAQVGALGKPPYRCSNCGKILDHLLPEFAYPLSRVLLPHETEPGSPVS